MSPGEERKAMEGINEEQVAEMSECSCSCTWFCFSFLTVRDKNNEHENGSFVTKSDLQHF